MGDLSLLGQPQLEPDPYTLDPPAPFFGIRSVAAVAAGCPTLKPFKFGVYPFFPRLTAWIHSVPAASRPASIPMSGAPRLTCSVTLRHLE